MTFECIRREATGTITTIFLDRPAQRNAMSAALVAELIAAIAAFEADDALRAMVLAGSGSGFCAGSDLRGLAAMTAEDKSAFEAESGRVARMIGECGKPIVAAVHGFAVGGGLTLAIAADIVVTDVGARWSLPEVPIGLFPAWGLGPLIRRAGITVARRLSWGVDVLDGAEARRLGLADILAEGDALSIALEMAGRLAALPPAQARAVKSFFAALGDEASDGAANLAFMAASRLPEGEASFAKFSAPRPAQEGSR